MDIFWKTAAGLLITSVLALSVERKEFSLLLMLTACVMGAAASVNLMRPVFTFLGELEQLVGLEDGVTSILLKAAGIALTAEISGSVCQDSGSGSLGKALQLVGSAAVLCLSVPLFRSLLQLIEGIMGGV